ncbi:5-hydroxytryptamine receptor 3A-like [Cottoperca gobio]|uniref:5-hydroxytryptamine receptor 3A-like n=1 Tax=Cottoperca gobio TaxID=56716 RepID=A0A6J2RQN9_COTGO|nr:5-hydroxytryptamine receptor 3A-like [Cottoperca gobio]
MCLDVLAVDGKSSNGSCRHRDVLQYLNLTQKNEMYAIARPGTAESPLNITLDVLLYAILDVNEKDQKFVSYIWIDSWWQNDDLFWNPDDFCGIERIYLPIELLWKPDLTIEEMTDKDKTLPSPHLSVDSIGEVILRNDMVVVSTCKLHIYQFPFDVQTCTLSFKSVVYNVADMQLVSAGSSSRISELSRKMMRTQSEWMYLNMTIYRKTVDNFGFHQSMLVYTIKMRRRSALYIANFLVPVLFFFCLDLASFLVSDRGGEKLSFKVTVLLAVTLMQLILNEILPSSSESIPLIVVYCIGIFGLMMLSLLETILLMYLVEKDIEADKDQSLSEDYRDKQGKAGSCNCFKGVNKLTHFSSTGETLSELLSVAKEVSIK